MKKSFGPNQLKNVAQPKGPVAPPAYRPQPVPRVLQTKMAGRPGSSTIQRSSQSKPRYTKVTASGGGRSVTGFSSNGPRAQSINQLLRRAPRRAEGRLFLFILQNVNPLSDPSDRRTGFSCAEPHAVAQLIAKGVALSEIRVDPASDDKGLMAECPVCAQWLDGRTIDVDYWRARYHAPAEVEEEAQAPAPQVNPADLQMGNPVLWPTPAEAMRAGLYKKKR